MAALDTVRPVGVVGAGTMGAGIAQVAALAGHEVRMLDAADGAAARAVHDVRRRIERLTEKGRLGLDEAHAASERVQMVHGIEGLGGCGLVIEAIAEDLAVKRRLFADLEDVVEDVCVLATNTSSLSVTAIAAPLRRPERVVGMHFFNPAPLMALVEIVSGATTDPEVADLVTETARAWRKTPVRCASAPGFIVNRVARPFYGEAHRLLEDRVTDAATIDAVLREAGGFRMGPLELTDLVGQDVNLAVSRSVWEQTFHDPRYAPSLVQQGLVDAGRLGRKSGLGVYRYDGDHLAADAGVPRTEPLRPAPSYVVDVGGFTVLDGLLDRIRGVGIAVRSVSEEEPVRGYRGRHAAAEGEDEPEDVIEVLPGGGVVLPSGGRLVETEGETATARSIVEPHVVVDWMLDVEQATRVALAPCDDCPPEVLAEAVGLMQGAGYAVSVVDDVAGMVVARTVAMLVNEAHDLVQRGTASAADVDTAMRLGTSYPLGPVEWGERVGATKVTSVLDALHVACPTGRYRVAPRLRRLALHEEALDLAAYADIEGVDLP